MTQCARFKSGIYSIILHTAGSCGDVTDSINNRDLDAVFICASGMPEIGSPDSCRPVSMRSSWPLDLCSLLTYVQ